MEFRFQKIRYRKEKHLPEGIELVTLKAPLRVEADAEGNALDQNMTMTQDAAYYAVWN